MTKRLFLQLSKEYVKHFPQYQEYFEDPILLYKSIYGTDFAHKVFSDDLTQWHLENKEMPFHNSEVDPSLYIHRDGDNILFLIIYVDDCL